MDRRSLELLLDIVVGMAEAFLREYARRYEERLRRLERMLEEEKKELKRVLEEIEGAEQAPPHVVEVVRKHGIPLEELR